MLSTRKLRKFQESMQYKTIIKKGSKKYIDDDPMFKLLFGIYLYGTIAGYFEIYVMPYDDSMHMFDSLLFGYDFSLWMLNKLYPFIVACFIGHFIYYLCNKNKITFKTKNILIILLLSTAPFIIQLLLA